MRYLVAAMQPRPFIGALIGAGAAIGGALIGRRSQKETNFANAQQAEQQMRFQEEMSKTAHQREVADLRAAGLNPILSGTGGAGASTPVGAMARMENPDKDTASTAMQIATATEQLKNLKETNANISADTDLKQAQRVTTSQQWNTLRAEEGFLNEKAATERENTVAARHNASILSNSAKAAELEGDIDETKYGAIMRYIDRAIKSLTGSSQSIRNLRQ